MAEQAYVKKRRRIRTDEIEFIVQFYHPSITTEQVTQLLLQTYKDFVQVNTFKRPNDTLDIKYAQLKTSPIKEAEDELRIAVVVELRHYTLIKYDYGGLRDQLILKLRMRNGSIVITPSNHVSFDVLKNYSVEEEAVEEMKQFYTPAQPAPVQQITPISASTTKQPSPFDSFIEYAKMGGCMVLGMMMGAKMGGVKVEAPQPQQPPQPTFGYQTLNF